MNVTKSKNDKNKIREFSDIEITGGIVEHSDGGITLYEGILYGDNMEEHFKSIMAKKTK